MFKGTTAPPLLYTTDLIRLSSPLLIVLLDLAIAWCRVPQYVQIPGWFFYMGLFVTNRSKIGLPYGGTTDIFFLICSKWNVVKVFVYYHSISAKPNLHIFGIEVNLHKIFILSTAYILDHGKVCYPDQSKSVQERNSEDIPSPSRKGPWMGSGRIALCRTSPEKEIKVILFSVPV